MLRTKLKATAASDVKQQSRSIEEIQAKITPIVRQQDPTPLNEEQKEGCPSAVPVIRSNGKKFDAMQGRHQVSMAAGVEDPKLDEVPDLDSMSKKASLLGQQWEEEFERDRFTFSEDSFADEKPQKHAAHASDNKISNLNGDPRTQHTGKERQLQQEPGVYMGAAVTSLSTSTTSPASSCGSLLGNPTSMQSLNAQHQQDGSVGVNNNAPSRQQQLLENWVTSVQPLPAPTVQQLQQPGAYVEVPEALLNPIDKINFNSVSAAEPTANVHSAGPPITGNAEDSWASEKWWTHANHQGDQILSKGHVTHPPLSKQPPSSNVQQEAHEAGAYDRRPGGFIQQNDSPIFWEAPIFFLVANIVTSIQPLPVSTRVQQPQRPGAYRMHTPFHLNESLTEPGFEQGSMTEISQQLEEEPLDSLCISNSNNGLLEARLVTGESTMDILQEAEHVDLAELEKELERTSIKEQKERECHRVGCCIIAFCVIFLTIPWCWTYQKT
jgi:hypothetical protein